MSPPPKSWPLHRFRGALLSLDEKAIYHIDGRWLVHGTPAGRPPNKHAPCPICLEELLSDEVEEEDVFADSNGTVMRTACQHVRARPPAPRP